MISSSAAAGSPLSSVRLPGAASALTAPADEATGGLNFQRMLLDSLNQTASLQNNADQLVQQGLVEGDATQVETLTSIRKAELSLKLMLQVRNKLMDAFTEIRQMQL